MYVCVCIYIYMYTPIHVCMNVCMYVCMYVHMCVDLDLLSICLSVCLAVCLSVCLSIYVESFEQIMFVFLCSGSASITTNIIITEAPPPPPPDVPHFPERTGMGETSACSWAQQKLLRFSSFRVELFSSGASRVQQIQVVRGLGIRNQSPA